MVDDGNAGNDNKFDGGGSAGSSESAVLDKVEAAVTICNKLGMHARAATKFVQLAAKYPCEVSVTKDGQKVNGKSIMGVLMLVAAKGTVISIEAKGGKAQACLDALLELVRGKFGEEA